MFKKILIIFILGFTILVGNIAFSAPPINCLGLPGCDQAGTVPSNKVIGVNPDSNITTGIAELISQMIQYVAVIAVLSLMVAGLMYLLSGGEEEKINKAKKMIIWSLVGVLLSISAWMIVNVINDMDISL